MNAAAGRELFIYWRTPAASAEQAMRAAEGWQARLRSEHPGLRAALYRRANEIAGGNSETVTLMEVYSAARGDGKARPSLLDAKLELRIVNEGRQVLGPWLAGPRHVEVFVRCATR